MWFHSYHPPKFQPKPKHHDGGLMFTDFACPGCSLLLLLLLLLLNVAGPP